MHDSNLSILLSPPASAAQNMAIDETLLLRSTETGQPVLRLYSWSETAWSFGYSQAWNELNPPAGITAVRRITGGGIVDHRSDYTYSLIFPPQHEFYHRKALEVYQSIHLSLSGVLNEFGLKTSLVPCPCPQSESPAGPKTCFVRPDPYDVILENSQKCAGAAMKRSKAGLLLQGSVVLPPETLIEKQVFQSRWSKVLGKVLHVSKVAHIKAGEIVPTQDLVAKYASKEWNQRR